MAAISGSESDEERYMIDEDELDRLDSRISHQEVFSKIQNAAKKINQSEMRVEHCCYIQCVGKISDFPRNQLHSKSFQSENVEMTVESTILYEKIKQLKEKRQEYAVVEDDFGPTLCSLVSQGKKPSYNNLVGACGKFDCEGLIELHRSTAEKSYKEFLKYSISEDEAKAFSFAIAFYTGAYSEMLNLNANIYARRWQRSKATNAENMEVDPDAAMIMHYLIRGLSHIPFYWGRVVRYVKLTKQALRDYEPGEILTWLQFSSSDKGDDQSPKHLSYFTNRNTKFIIYSLTGRSIREYSNCSDQEDEVLFLPHSTFLVCYKEVKDGKNLIYLRQLELGLCQYVVLWVDDHIFDDWWENKGHMEKASTLGTSANVHFIPKSTTESALAFLRSPFGDRLKASNTFRIVTDMNRDNELSSPSDAGARLIFEVRRLGFNQECMIFTGDANASRAKMRTFFKTDRLTGVKITQYPDDLERFVIFK